MNSRKKGRVFSDKENNNETVNKLFRKGRIASVYVCGSRRNVVNGGIGKYKAGYKKDRRGKGCKAKGSRYLEETEKAVDEKKKT